MSRAAAARTRRASPGGPARVVAHRGAWGPAPQNSAAAFARAIAVGADAVELDVRRTADHRLVVVHDARIGLRPLSRLTRDQVRTRLRPGQAPELADVLAGLDGRIGVDVELKEDGYVAEALAVVQAALPGGDFVVTSFLDGVLSQVRAAAPDARVGLLIASRRRLRRLDERLRATGADFLAPHVGLLGDGLLDWTAERGLPAWPWTVNDGETARALLSDPRVEAVITDRPADAVGIAAGAAG